MPQRGPKTHEDRVYGRSKPAQDQNDDYDVYLFWPSLSSKDISSGDPHSSPLYGPVSSLHSESTDFDYPGMSSGPPSPVVFAATADCQFSRELDFGAGPPGVPAKVRKASEQTKVSPLFKVGLLFSQMTRLVDRAIDGVKIRICKPKPQAS